MILVGDCVEQMATLPDASVDAVVTDPPYGIGFMGHEWDQPGVEARANGQPAVFASGRKSPYPDHVAGQRRQKAPTQSDGRFGGPLGYDRNLGAERGGAMNAGRYDLSAAANRRYQAWCELWAIEAYRVLKPGGHLLASCGPRTYHRLAAGVEDAGFEIRDSIMWLYGSGFPKSYDVAKAVDRVQGVEGDWVQEDHPGRAGRRNPSDTGGARIGQLQAQRGPGDSGLRHIYQPETPEAQRWDGWGTALKPSHEPVVVARKPLAGTVVDTVLEFGTGAINIDACRVGVSKDVPASPGGRGEGNGIYGAWSAGQQLDDGGMNPNIGRWPPNVAMDEETAAELDAAVGERAAGGRPGTRAPGTGYGGHTSGTNGEREATDAGGPSRYFYCPKASKAERNAGLTGPAREVHRYGAGIGEGLEPEAPSVERNIHPTVKPLPLMRWLCRLVCPPGGVVLDPFLGSGTTGAAAALEGFEFIGIERDAKYAEIAEPRIQFWLDHKDDPIEQTLAAFIASEREAQRHQDAGQMGLLDPERVLDEVLGDGS